MRSHIRELVLLAVLLLLFGVPWWTLTGSGTAWPTGVFLAGTVLFGVALVAFPMTMYLGHSRRAKDWAARIGDTMLGAIWVLFAWSIIGQILELALLGVDDPLRSRLVAGFVAIAAVVLLTWGHFEAMRVPRIRAVDVTIPGLGKDFDGAKLVVVSDTHYGPINRAGWSAKVAKVVTDLDADIVAHAGDVADGSPSRRKDQAAPLGTVQARLAKVYITGNHEYFSEAQAWLDHMADLGWEPLHNKHIVVTRGTARLVIAGVDDATAKASGIEGHGADLTRALDGADPDLPVILLAHQPKQIGQALDRVDLQISGHTHGGQIWPFHYLVRMDQGTVHGLSRHGSRTQLYTSSGSGFWGPPFRIFAPSEITVITLRA
ncbi:metallophosphoesterase [Kibdelosporangium aridum]|uniref:metallophosphoesterase n=1 Tax=Kibdelosporangium aridum TaxID=2030 RepID=UPI000A5CF3B5|nr:metallophosphoesterase [Kibdelosporangium aridum]